MMVGVKVDAITDQGLTIVTQEGKQLTLEADTIIPSLPLQSDPHLFNKLKERGMELYQIGDCKESGLMHDAIAEGSRIARMI